ncbi:MAG TPA: acetylxylan esterase [Lacipirellulaceae bacterium]|mgnify:CR=1 FL=1|nr:acetylxylan esterase [Lacipirellulaceae bacterium]
MRTSSVFSPGRLALLAAALVLAGPATGEIQTLFRGASFSEPDAARKLDEMAALVDSADQWRMRAEAIRRGVRRGMRLERLPPPGALNPIRHSTHAGDGYTVENVAFESLPGFWVTGNLYLPAEVEGRIPGVLCPHGHAPDGRLHEATQIRCAMLARMGAAALAYDMVGFGESQPVPHRHSETMRLQTYNSMRALDFLLSLGMVDEGRLAVTGESGGGTQSFLLAALDERVAASVPVVQVSAHFYGGCVCESGLPIHKSAEHETNNVEIAASFAPKPQLIVSDGADWTRNTPQVEFPFIQRVYGLLGAADRVANAHFADEGHDYGPSKRAAMYPFLAEHLGLDLSRATDAAGQIDERPAAPRPRAALLVFPPERPRPAHAAERADDVIALRDRRE